MIRSIGLLRLALYCVLQGRSSLHGTSPVRAQGDTSLFAAVIKDVVSSDLRGAIKVDPWPLIADPALTGASVEDRVPRRLADLEARRLSLAALHVDEANRTPDHHCPGRLVARSPAIDSIMHQECPSTIQTFVTIGLPRPGGAYFPGGSVDQRSRDPASHLQSVRVIVTELAPNGSITSVLDIVVRRANQKWAIVEEVGLLSVH